MKSVHRHTHTHTRMQIYTQVHTHKYSLQYFSASFLVYFSGTLKIFFSFKYWPLTPQGHFELARRPRLWYVPVGPSSAHLLPRRIEGWVLQLEGGWFGVLIGELILVCYDIFFCLCLECYRCLVEECVISAEWMRLWLCSCGKNKVWVAKVRYRRVVIVLSVSFFSV